MAFGDDDFSRLEPFLHDGVLIDLLRGDDRALLDGGILLHHEHVLTVLAGLHGLRRHDDRVGHAWRAAAIRARTVPATTRDSAFANVAFSLIVSVVVSTALSTKVSAPVVGCAPVSCGVAVTGSFSPAMCCLIVER